jgi:hypothetical protein
MINHLRKTIISCFLLCICTFSNAGEILTVLNSEFYTNGETLEGAILFSNVDANGKVLKYSLIQASSDKIIHAGFTKVNNDKASFGYDIGFGVESQEIRIEITVLGASYNEYLIGMSKFLIINPSMDSTFQNYKSINQFNKLSSVGIGNLMIAKSENNLSLTGNSNISIVNISQSPFSNINVTSNNIITQGEVNSWQNKIYFNGTLVQGSKPTVQNILGLYDVSNDKFYMTKTLVNGNFIFLLNDFSGINNYQLFPYGDKYNTLTFIRNKPISKLQFNENLLDKKEIELAIEDIKKRSSIHQYFGISNPIRTPSLNQRTEQAFKSYKRINPANYKPFPIFHSFCKENSLPIVFEEVDNKYKALSYINAAFSKKFNTTSENPLFIINGIATRNYDAIARLKTNEIELIEVFMDFENQRKPYNVFGSDPIIKLKTKTSDNLLSKFERGNFTSINGFIKDSDYKNNFIVKNRSLNLTPILEPKIYFGSINENTIIPLPDNKGTIDILSIIKTPNQGFQINKQTYNSL